MKKYAEATIKAVAVQERARLVFRRKRPSRRRWRKTRVLKDGKEKGGHPKEEKTTQAKLKDQDQDSGQGGQPH